MEQQALEKELHVFERHKREWLQSHPEDFVVIGGTTIGGFYPDYESAFEGGVTRFGARATFLVKQIWAEEPVYLIH
jgi:hypothetical protein